MWYLIRSKFSLKVFLLISIPLFAWAAISWSNGTYSAPASFRQAAANLGLRVTEVCRSANASYGARNSPHKRCQAMDISKNTSGSKIAAMRQYGLCPQFHPKGYYGATGDHYHVTVCSNSNSRGEARRDQRSRASDIRKRNRSGQFNERTSRRRDQNQESSFGDFDGGRR